MANEVTEYLQIDSLALILGLPVSYLEWMAQRGHIPALDVGGRMRFDEAQVRAALRQHAAAEAIGRAYVALFQDEEKACEEVERPRKQGKPE